MFEKENACKRKAKGLSQEELAVKLNVVRQTVSKWEQGLSVPDSDMLISLSDALETPVSTLLGENVVKQEADELKAICEKLEVINLQLARRKIARRAALHWLIIALCAAIIISRLEFRRPGNCGFRHCLSCVRVAVCPIRADSFCRFARRGFYDAKEMICLICPLPIGRGIFRVENAAGCGIIKAGNQ